MSESDPFWAAPQLATLTDRRFRDPGWVFERKLDGVRAIVGRHDGRVRIHSRAHRDVTTSYPEIADAVARAGAPEVLLDGEIVAFDGDRTSFGLLQQRLGLSDASRIRSTGVAVSFFAFDLLRLGAQDTRRLPLVDRKGLLADALRWDAPLRYGEHVAEDGIALFDRAVAEGWEGVIAKRADAAYVGGRSHDWLKMKTSQEQEFVVGGFTPPSGGRTAFGALLVGYYDEGMLTYAGKVGTGFDQATLRALRQGLDQMTVVRSPFVDPPREKGATWVHPELVVQIAFGEWTSTSRLRHPTYRGIRDDKEPRDVRREG